MQKRSDTPGDPQVPGGRSVRVRSRLVAGVALVGITVIGAGVPGLLTTSADLTESQRLVTLAKLNRQAVTLAHSLADERDEVTAYIAAGRGAATADDDGGDDSDDHSGADQGQDGQGRGSGAKAALPTTHTARVDRQIEEIRADAPDDVRRALVGVPALRRTALTGKGTALEAHRAYTEVIGRLQALAAELADRTPARAAGTGRAAPAELGQAVERASATRGLLLAALAVPGADKPDRTEFDPVTGTYETRKDPGAEAAARTRDQLSAAAHLARVREQVALADFGQAADTAARESLAATVTGPEVTAADGYLGKLTDRSELSADERRTDPEKLEAALTARVEQMRGVESSLATGQVERMEQLRDDDVTAAELRIALLGGCLLVAIGVSTAVARTLTRPLAVLRIGAARLADAPETEEPVRFTGRNDEFAQVVRSLNTLHGKLLALAGRADGDGEREAVAAELAAGRAQLRGETDRLTAELERLRHTVHHTFVNLSLRTLGLVERQLTVIEKLEEREQDSERLATLFKLDHMATVMRRHSENLLILAGHEHSHTHQGPVPLVDVLRAAVSEIERYERVAIQSLPQHAYVAGFAADDLSHLLAELLENATSFSPPDAQVQLSGWLLEGGDVMLSVQDKGIGMTPARLADLNARMANPSAEPEADPVADPEESGGLGLKVAALLAARHGVRVELRQEQGGVTAVVVLPRTLLPDAPPTAAPPSVAVADGGPTLNLPGSVAEANSNALQPRRSTPPTGPSADPEAASAEAPPAEALPAEAPSVQVESAEAPCPEGPSGEAPSAVGVSAVGVSVEVDAAEEGASPGEAPQADAAESAKPLEDAQEPGVEPTEADLAGVQGDAALPGPHEGGSADEDGETRAAPGAESNSGAETSAFDDALPRGRETGAAQDGDEAATPEDAPEAGAPLGAGDPVDGVGGFDHPDGGRTGGTALETNVSADAADDDRDDRDDHEVTLQVRLPLPAAEPDTHERVGGDPAPAWERVTDKGLPKRTPRVVDAGAPRGERTGGIDAEELRRRLGGFQQGARDGRRDAEAEIAHTVNARTGNARTEETPGTGDTVEEAHS